MSNKMLTGNNLVSQAARSQRKTTRSIYLLEKNYDTICCFCTNYPENITWELVKHQSQTIKRSIGND